MKEMRCLDSMRANDAFRETHMALLGDSIATDLLSALRTFVSEHVLQ